MPTETNPRSPEWLTEVLDRARKCGCPECVRVLEAAQAAREEGRREIALVLWRLYKATHREGWEPGESEQEMWDGVVDVLSNLGMDPNTDPPPGREGGEG